MIKLNIQWYGGVGHTAIDYFIVVMQFLLSILELDVVGPCLKTEVDLHVFRVFKLSLSVWSIADVHHPSLHVPLK